MKKTILSIVIAVTFVIALTSFIKSPPPPPLYAELEAFFKSVDVKQVDKSHISELEGLKRNIATSDLDAGAKWGVIFYCSENSFRSQASQVFMQTLCYANRHRNMLAYSAGLTAAEVDPMLVNYLTKIGYKVTAITKEGRPGYEVRFADKADPIILFSKTVKDKSLPAKDVASVVVCDIAKEVDCTSLKTETTPFHLPFQKVTKADGVDKAETTLKSIAAEMMFVTNK